MRLSVKLSDCKEQEGGGKQTHHHEVELAVGRAGGLEAEGDLAEVAAGDGGQRRRDPGAEGQARELTRGDV